MNKQQTLALLKDSIISVIQREDDLRNNVEFRNKWMEQNKKIKESIEKMSEEDMEWSNEEYVRWENTNPIIKEAKARSFDKNNKFKKYLEQYFV